LSEKNKHNPNPEPEEAAKPGVEEDSPRGEEGEPDPAEAAPPPPSRTRKWSIRAAWLVLIAVVLPVLFAGSFYLTMRAVLAGREVIVPDLSGLSMEDARVALQEVGLNFEESSERHDASIEKDHVTAQKPTAGTVIKRNRKIRVTISLGPLEVPIPDVRGQTLRSAELALQREGLTVGKIAYTHGDLTPDVVLAQDPPPGHEPFTEDLDAEDQGVYGTVDLLVSRGEFERVYVMPDLTRLSLEDVEALAKRTGLRLGAVRRQRDSGVERGRVIRQYPQAGYPVGRQDIISLVLSD
jgi:serine/threonine-protein kinase